MEYKEIKKEIELSVQHANGFQRKSSGQSTLPGLESGLDPPQTVSKLDTPIIVNEDYVKIQTKYHYFPEIEEYPHIFHSDEHVDISSEISQPGMMQSEEIVVKDVMTSKSLDVITNFGGPNTDHVSVRDNIEKHRQVKQRIVKKDNYGYNVYPEKEEDPKDITNEQLQLCPPGSALEYYLKITPHMSLNRLQYLQMTDKEFGPIIKGLEKQTMERYYLSNNILIYINDIKINSHVEKVHVICVPNQIAYDTVNAYHNSIFGLHAHLKKLMGNLKRVFYIKKIKYIAQMVNDNCLICNKYKFMLQPPLHKFSRSIETVPFA